MHSIWTGSISFGLVNIPIKLYSAVTETQIDFDMLDKKDLSGVRYAKISKATGREIPYEDIVKGYKYDDEHYVVVSKEDFDKVSPEKTKAIEIIDFVKATEIDAVYYEKTYFLEPEKNGAKSYGLLKEALSKSGKAGVALFVLRNKQHLSIIKPYENIIVLHQLHFNTELRKTADLKIPETDIKAKELEMALSLIEQLSGKFDPQNYKDNYTEDLMKIIDQKAKGKTTKAEAPVKSPAKVKDLMSLLKESLIIKKKVPKKEKENA
jgi:DNA end-binding protein Ku